MDPLALPARPTPVVGEVSVAIAVSAARYITGASATDLPLVSCALVLKVNDCPGATVEVFGVMCTLAAFAPAPVYARAILTGSARSARADANVATGPPLNSVSPCASMQ